MRTDIELNNNNFTVNLSKNKEYVFISKKLIFPFKIIKKNKTCFTIVTTRLTLDKLTFDKSSEIRTYLYFNKMIYNEKKKELKYIFHLKNFFLFEKEEQLFLEDNPFWKFKPCELQLKVERFKFPSFIKGERKYGKVFTYKHFVKSYLKKLNKKKDR